MPIQIQSQTPMTPEQQVAAIRQELDGILKQIPRFQGVADRLKRAQDDLMSNELDPMTAMQSAVGALLFCQTFEFENGIRQLAEKADMLEKVLKAVEGGKPNNLVTPATNLPPGMGQQGKRFGR